MITETTAISCAAFGALSTGLSIAAGIGWMRCARMLAVRDITISELLTELESWQFTARDRLVLALQIARKRNRWQRLASDLQERLDTEAAKRSSITSRGNLTKAAKRKAAITATTNQLQREVAERAEPARIAA